MKKCEDCGCSVDSRGYCTNCHEEVFIADQYNDLDMAIPKTINNKIDSFKPKI